METLNKESFHKCLVEEWDKLLEYFTDLKDKAKSDRDIHMFPLCNGTLMGIKETIKIYQDNLLAQMIYNDLITLEVDDLILKYPIV